METQKKPELKQDEQQRPNVFKYFEYRLFLKDFVDYLIKNKGESKRRISRACGFRSASYLPMLIMGQRDLGAAGVRAISKGFSLTKDEAIYFSTLVDHQTNPSAEHRSEAFSRLVKLRAHQGLEELIPSQMDAFVHWQCVVVFEALATQWANLSIDEQAKSLGLSIERLEQILQNLEELNLIRKESGVWTRRATKIQSTRDIHTQFMRQYHLDMLKRAEAAIVGEELSDRFVQNVTLSLSPESYRQLIRLLDEFTTEVSVGFPGDPKATGVYQLSVHLFSLLNLPR